MMQLLLSLPTAMAHEVNALEPEFARDGFAACDPPGSNLGSGGGSAHLLVEAWRATGGALGFNDWLGQSRKLLIHAGGQSRRLPAYAAVGKAFIPMPVMRWSVGQRLQQTLLDLQLPFYRQVLSLAPQRAVAMLASGDVILRGGNNWPAFPDVDVLALGLWVQPEQAQHFGVFFCPRAHPEQLAFVLQKPAPDRIRELAANHVFMVDTGVWLLSDRAVHVLLRKCGLDPDNPRGTPQPYEFYAEMATGFGRAPRHRDPEVNALSCAVVPLPAGEFYHFGTSRDLIQSVTKLQNRIVDQTKLGFTIPKPHPDQHTQNAVIHAPLNPTQHTLWVENAVIPSTWQLTHDHVLTGVPDNNWKLRLEPGVCLDFAPVGDNEFCVRAYGMDDPFRTATWFGRPAAEWFIARGITGADLNADWQTAPLFPVVKQSEITGAWLEWLSAAKPAANPAFAKRWQASQRLSARQLSEQVCLRRLYVQRAVNRQQVLLPLAENHARSVFYKLDLQSTTDLFAAARIKLPPELPADDAVEPMKSVHDQMFRAAVLRRRGALDWEQHEVAAFAQLRQLLLQETEAHPVQPTCQVQEDQIIWGRSPVRLDLAGGWTDTPPYCLLHGGQVVNLAVNLNGQPPIQVFAKLSEKPEIVVRSIDLGSEERIRTYEELASYAQVGSGFAVAKAALALAGFLPRFRQGGKSGSLEEQLRQFGGGIEVAMLCAVPKGSGLGTSSILSATVLGTLSELGGLNWTQHDLIQRTLALEQMLTTGGGWQDQAGGLLRGIKLIETPPGLAQKPTVRWLPENFFAEAHPDPRVLLYYTGLTRVAKGILQEIVRGMFLNSHTHLAIIEEIGQNAGRVADALQRADWSALCAGVRRSWELNQQLDQGTNPPAVQAIFDQVSADLAAAKLLGAGGGGYLLMFAKDETAAQRVRQSLTQSPPNPKARFVELSVSETGFQVTRS